MASLNEQFLNFLSSGIEDNNDTDLCVLPDDLLEVYNSGEVIPGDFNAAPLFSYINTGTPSGFSPENNSNSNSQEQSSVFSQAAAFPSDMQSEPTCLKIIAQPYYGTKLRYRSDYATNESRLGVMKNRTANSSYQGPAITIPKCYLSSNGEYYIRVCLVTAKYDKTDLHYFHPYELENPCNQQLNNKQYNAVWFPIKPEDCITGTKSFPTLRIVKNTASELKKYGPLRVFDCDSQSSQHDSLPQCSSAKETINKYNLEKSQLAFTVGTYYIENGQSVMICYPETTVFSDEMIEGVGKESDGDNDTEAKTDRPSPSLPTSRAYKYAPKSGFADSIEDMLIFLTTKLEPKKYGELKITFECDVSDVRWSQPISELDIKDRMVSFKTPIFPYLFENTMRVDVILRQNDHILQTLYYYYLPTYPCSTCKANAMRNETNGVRNVPNKRSTSSMIFGDFEDDTAVVPVSENAPEFRQSVSELKPSPPATTTSFTSLPAIPITQPDKDTNQQIMDKLADSIESLFSNNDYTSFLRLCRPFIIKRPQSLNDALDKDHSDLLKKFLPVATKEILQKRNQFGETVLLHATRLNRIDIIKILLEKKDSDNLLVAVDSKSNNIFHLLALNCTSSEIFDLFINHLLQISMDIKQKFDHINEEHYTPLQLSISKNNLLATKYFLKYFNTNVYETNKRTGDNLIHLAIRDANLIMVKYLIEEGKLIEQGNQTNLTMTPIELSRSLKHDDITEYLNEKYPQIEINEDESSEDD